MENVRLIESMRYELRGLLNNGKRHWISSCLPSIRDLASPKSCRGSFYIN
jgi:hypothetical protein